MFDGSGKCGQTKSCKCRSPVGGSSGHRLNSVVQNPANRHFCLKTEDTVSSLTDLNKNHSRKNESRNNETIEDNDFATLYSKYDLQTHIHHTVTIRNAPENHHPLFTRRTITNSEQPTFTTICSTTIFKDTRFNLQHNTHCRTKTAKTKFRLTQPIQ